MAYSSWFLQQQRGYSVASEGDDDVPWFLTGLRFSYDPEREKMNTLHLLLQVIVQVYCLSVETSVVYFSS